MKKLISITLLLISSLLVTGCIKTDKMDNIDIVTTVYPVTYLAEQIYGDNSTIVSIYPNGIDVENYEITDKQIKEYAKSDLFIYNGLDSKEKKIATKLINENKNIKLIDATQGLTVNSTDEELWLSPTNYLMMAQNIKEHLSDFMTSNVLKNKLQTNYENIKLTISKFDANFKIIAENAKDKDVIVANSSLGFLKRYGFNIISLDENEDKYKSNLTKAKANLASETNKVIFAIDNKTTEDINKLDADIINVKSMTILSLEDIKNKNNYQSLMNEFIEELRNEVYS
jgi:zinc transport system substrate-binding protein